jgi:hypothetical protein
MGELTIEISSDGTPSYPRGQTVNPGDTVTFQYMGTSGEVEVTFDSTSCCFTSSDPLTLGPQGSLVPNSLQKTVASNARASPPPYPFYAGPPSKAAKAATSGDHRPPPNWEAKRGEVDVSTDTGW